MAVSNTVIFCRDQEADEISVFCHIEFTNNLAGLSAAPVFLHRINRMAFGKIFFKWL
jgi:hypothetical protein